MAHRSAAATAAITATALISGAVLPASAPAISAEQKLSARTSPATAGTKRTPRNVRLYVRPYIPGVNVLTPPFATTAGTVYFDRNIVFNGSRFPSCRKGTVQANEKRCPSLSRVGSGTAEGLALGLTEKLEVTIFNGPRYGRTGRFVELLVTGSEPLTIRSVIQARLTKRSGTYGYKLTVPIPDNLQEPAPGALATLTDFDTQIKRTRTRRGTKVPYIGLRGCTNGRLRFKYIGEYTDGTSQRVITTSRCRRR